MWVSNTVEPFISSSSRDRSVSIHFMHHGGSNQVVHLAMTRKWIEIGSRDDELMKGSTAFYRSYSLERSSKVWTRELKSYSGHLRSTKAAPTIPNPSTSSPHHRWSPKCSSVLGIVNVWSRRCTKKPHQHGAPRPFGAAMRGVWPTPILNCWKKFFVKKNFFCFIFRWKKKFFIKSKFFYCSLCFQRFAKVSSAAALNA